MISTVQSEAGPSRISPHVSLRPSSSSRSRITAAVDRQGRVEEQAEEYEGCDPLDVSSSSAVSSLLANERAAPRSVSRFTSSSSRRQSSSFALLPLLATLALALAMISRAPMQASALTAGTPNNITSLMGTWSTGSAKVSTGIDFYNPVNVTFTIPATGGQSYSFTDDGYYEEALYIYTANPAKPSCVAASLFWQHGTWTLNSNNSLSLTPFNGDGRQLTEDRCSSTSTTSAYYYQEEYMLGFDITLDIHFGRPEYRLQLYAFDGALKPVMWQTYNPPQMLPTELLVETIYGSTS